MGTPGFNKDIQCHVIWLTIFFSKFANHQSRQVKWAVSLAMVLDGLFGYAYRSVRRDGWRGMGGLHELENIRKS